ncbi:DUF3159 domain-containing protein [Gordonia sp. zg691]|uniref:DUF3159 domain-containing protein n=1 Tax=Gordonia jinghuaiqii TaxID=2758710 RepID=A0A7D7LU49_9ACTN|nr:DUF3159 domain-containing protein [Gordonia jinghuaiqii]MBD0861404.1 DUF3159 domain-containing protein [Gordonia jinghuaiqii]MCR5976304.1 DUF3159 domain-containing protein [Gordonia jinghuaiqii]QMT03523.1 DUF3159 domain-containing protein [Gordonia jinghuaiqii]
MTDDVREGDERSGDESVGAREPVVDRAPTVLEQIGGVSGLIYSTIPVVVFVPVNSLFGLRTAIYAALGVAALLFVVRVVRREPVTPAVSGLLGVAICVFIAHEVGDAKGYFLFGIWTTLAYAIVFAASILVRRPLVGVAWHLVNGEDSSWRRNRLTLRAYDIATALWALVFGARYLTQSELYDAGATGWLAFTRIAMGWPLTALAVLGTILLVRRASAQERSAAAADELGA